MRFKQTLRRDCRIPAASRVCVAWSGGLCSSVLARLVREAREEVDKRRLLMRVSIVHVNCAAIKAPRSDEQRARDEAERDDLLRSFHAPFHVLPLSAVYDVPSDRRPPPPSASSSASSEPFFSQDPEHRAAADERLRALFLSCPASSHPSLLSHLLSHLLSYFARYHRYAALLSGESATHAASACMAAILKGQGRHVQALSAARERRLGAVWAYPLRDVSNGALAYYFHYRQLSVLDSLGPVHVRASSTAIFAASTPSASPRAPPTLDGAASAFIARLDALFPQTVSNVLRTVEKVVGPSVDAPICAWCGHRIHEAASSSLHLSTASQASASPTPPSPSSVPACYDCSRSFGSVMQSAADDAQSNVPPCIAHFDWVQEHEEWEREESSGQSQEGDDSEAARSSGRGPVEAVQSTGGHHGGGAPQRQSRSALRAQIASFLLEDSASDHR